MKWDVRSRDYKMSTLAYYQLHGQFFDGANLFGPCSQGLSKGITRCVASCTAHLEELKDPVDRIMGVGARATFVMEQCLYRVSY